MFGQNDIHVEWEVPHCAWSSSEMVVEGEADWGRIQLIHSTQHRQEGLSGNVESASPKIPLIDEANKSQARLRLSRYPYLMQRG